MLLPKLKFMATGINTRVENKNLTTLYSNNRSTHRIRGEQVIIHFSDDVDASSDAERRCMSRPIDVQLPYETMSIVSTLVGGRRLPIVNVCQVSNIPAIILVSRPHIVIATTTLITDAGNNAVSETESRCRFGFRAYFCH